MTKSKLNLLLDEFYVIAAQTPSWEQHALKIYEENKKRVERSQKRAALPKKERKKEKLICAVCKGEELEEQNACSSCNEE